MNKIKTLIAAVMLSFAASVSAQNLESGYFTDGYLYRHELNPAFGNDKAYVAMPMIGNFNMEINGTLGLKDVLYNVNGRTVTFLNPGVSTSEFLNNIKDDNKFGTSLKMQVLGAGFKAFGGYNTFEVNARAEMHTDIPGTLLSVAKEGLTNKSYDFSNFSANANVFTEIAFGHSRQINEQLRVGAKVKVLLGISNVDADFRKAELNLGEDSYTANVDAEIRVSAKDVKFEYDVNEDTNHKYVSDFDDTSMGLSGFGLALDLGAEYKLNDDFKFSAAILDFGFLNYGKTFVASTNGEKTFNTDKYIFNVNDDAPNNFDDELDKMKNDVSALYELEDKGDQGGSGVGIGTTLRLGAEYSLPVYRKLTFGALATTRVGKYSWTDFRLSANVAPVKIFSAGVNVSAGTFGMGFGGILNFHTTGFNFYVAMDRTLGSMAKQGVPLSSNASLSMGLNFPF